MGNSDPFLTYLKSFGYSVVRLPRTDIRPLQLLLKHDTHLSRLGDLTTIIAPGPDVPLPAIKENVAVSNITGQQTRDLSAGVGLTLLGSIVGAMGGTTIGLDAGYKQAKTASFEFTNVLEDRVELLEVDQYLAGADVRPFTSHVAQLLEADAVYVTTAVIKSTTFIVQAKGSDGTALDVSVPVIQDIVGGSVAVTPFKGAGSRIVYQGQVPLVFGFQAARLYYQDGRYSAFKPLTPGEGALERTVGAPRPDFLVTDSPFTRLDA